MKAYSRKGIGKGDGNPSHDTKQQCACCKNVLFSFSTRVSVVWVGPVRLQYRLATLAKRARQEFKFSASLPTDVGRRASDATCFRRQADAKAKIIESYLSSTHTLLLLPSCNSTSGEANALPVVTIGVYSRR